MRAGAPTLTRSRALRGAAAVVVAVGYLAALSATSIGNGWRLVPHLALEHGATVEAPRVLEDESGPVVLTTLRAVHRHGGHAHTHSLEGATSRTARHLEDAHSDLEGDVHEHDGVAHSHRAPPDETALVTTVALDKHRPAGSAAVPGPAVRDLSGFGEARETLGTQTTDVETPPPIRRG